MKRVFVFALAGAFMLGATLAGSSPTKSCCLKPSVAASTVKTAETQELRCSLTGKTVLKCCCVEREGKTYCTLARKDVATCCCAPVSEKPGK